MQYNACQDVLNAMRTELAAFAVQATLFLRLLINVYLAREGARRVTLTSQQLVCPATLDTTLTSFDVLPVTTIIAFNAAQTLKYVPNAQ